MVHLQLRLSCGVAEVKGPINEACVKMLAKLLAYKLKIVKFQSVLDLKTQMSGFEGDENHRGTLMLVTDLPASAGKIVDWPHRMVLCYSDDEKNAAFAPSKSAKAKQQAIASESTKAKKHWGCVRKLQPPSM